MRIKNRAIKNYIRVMDTLDMSEEKKQEIIHNCALYATSRKIKTRNYRIVSVKAKEETV